GDRAIRFETGEDVDVIRHSTDFEQDASLLSNDPSEVVVDPLAESFLQERDAVFGGEHDVDEEIGEGVCHGGGSFQGTYLRSKISRPILRGRALSPLWGLGSKGEGISPGVAAPGGALTPGYTLWPLWGLASSRAPISEGSSVGSLFDLDAPMLLEAGGDPRPSPSARRAAMPPLGIMRASWTSPPSPHRT